MLKLSSAQMEQGRISAEAGFIGRLREFLYTRHPDFLPAYPEPVARWVFNNMIARARGFGATWESNIAKLCDMMVVLAPNLLSTPEVYASVYPTYRRIGERPAPDSVDLRLKVFDRKLSDGALAAIRAQRSDIELYTPADLDGAGVDKRTAFALRLLFPDIPTDADATARAQAGVERAQDLGIAKHPDGPLLVAAAQTWAPKLAEAPADAALLDESPGLRVDRFRAALIEQSGQRV